MNFVYIGLHLCVRVSDLMKLELLCGCWELNPDPSLQLLLILYMCTYLGTCVRVPSGAGLRSSCEPAGRVLGVKLESCTRTVSAFDS